MPRETDCGSRGEILSRATRGLEGSGRCRTNVRTVTLLKTLVNTNRVFILPISSVFNVSTCIYDSTLPLRTLKTYLTSLTACYTWLRHLKSPALSTSPPHWLQPRSDLTPVFARLCARWRLPLTSVWRDWRQALTVQFHRQAPLRNRPCTSSDLSFRAEWPRS